MNMRSMAVALVLCASVASAQARGGRRGGPPPEGPLCLDPRNIERIEIVKGPSAAAAYGPSAANGIITIIPSAGLAAGALLSQCGSPRPDQDPFAQYLFDPQVVMSNQQAIGLTDAQKLFIQTKVLAAQQKFAETDIKLRGEMERLQALLRVTTVDEPKVLEQMDRLLNLERDMKRTQVDLMINLKNKLTDQQQQALQKLLDCMRGGRVIAGSGGCND